MIQQQQQPSIEYSIPVPALDETMMMKIDEPVHACTTLAWASVHDTTTKPPSRKRPRTVRFSDARIVGLVANRIDLFQSYHAGQIWYPSAELDRFKTEARTFCCKLREQQKNGETVDDNLIPRGLEHRVCFQRQRQRYLAIRCVLKAQQRNRNTEFVAMVARKCNQWATDIAQLEGQHDYVDVYQPTLKAFLPKVKDLHMHELPIQAKKRQNEAADVVEEHTSDCSGADSESIHDAQRNVRARNAYLATVVQDRTQSHIFDARKSYTA